MIMEKWCTKCQCIQPICEFNLRRGKPRPECRKHYTPAPKAYVVIARPQDFPSEFNLWRGPVDRARVLRWEIAA
jgi:hypothetical protein